MDSLDFQLNLVAHNDSISEKLGRIDVEVQRLSSIIEASNGAEVHNYVVSSILLLFCASAIYTGIHFFEKKTVSLPEDIKSIWTQNKIGLNYLYIVPVLSFFIILISFFVQDKKQTFNLLNSHDYILGVLIGAIITFFVTQVFTLDTLKDFKQTESNLSNLTKGIEELNKDINDSVKNIEDSNRRLHTNFKDFIDEVYLMLTVDEENIEELYLLNYTLAFGVIHSFNDKFIDSYSQIMNTDKNVLSGEMKKKSRKIKNRLKEIADDEDILLKVLTVTPDELEQRFIDRIIDQPHFELPVGMTKIELKEKVISDHREIYEEIRQKSGNNCIIKNPDTIPFQIFLVKLKNNRMKCLVLLIGTYNIGDETVGFTSMHSKICNSYIKLINETINNS